MMLKHAALSVLFLMMFAALGHAQDTFHVFPQVADGRFSDGSYYRTTFLILPWFDSDTPSCNLRLYGLSAGLNNSVTATSFDMKINAGSYFIGVTQGVQSIRTGYATLTCSDYVFAQALYSSYAPNGAKLAEATVFSSRETYSVRMILDQRESAHLGVAIANNTDIAHDYQITLGSKTATVRVQARSSLAKFADELLSIAPGTTGILTVEAADFSKFSAIGLRYTGAAFTTIPAN